MFSCSESCETLTLLVSVCVIESEMFQEDIYPNTAAPNPSLSAEEWIKGQNADPVYVPITVCLLLLTILLLCTTQATD